MSDNIHRFKTVCKCCRQRKTANAGGICGLCLDNPDRCRLATIPRTPPKLNGIHRVRITGILGTAPTGPPRALRCHHGRGKRVSRAPLTRK